MGYLYAEYNGTYGYRRLTDELNARYETNYNYKRIYRLTQLADIKAAGNVLNTNVPHQKLRLRTF
ncbi:transposase [Marinicrinis lubricantis]|uniref:Transposase n=1 Tax=Marinicrinis lubricantis TaxID=2086470 RepID=A0ABW1INH1_9BACL